MQEFVFQIYVIGDAVPVKLYKVRAPSEGVARGYCRGQCAMMGWALRDIRRVGV